MSTHRLDTTRANECPEGTGLLDATVHMLRQLVPQNQELVAGLGARNITLQVFLDSEMIEERVIDLLSERVLLQGATG